MIDPVLEVLGLSPVWVRRRAGVQTLPSAAVSTALDAAPVATDVSASVNAGSAQPVDAAMPALGRIVLSTELVSTVESAGAAVDANAGTPVASLDWRALRDRVADCRLCTLCNTRTQTVFGVGDEAADWMVIGEAPGATEDRIGEPFVGEAGKLLDNMLRALGLSRQRNVFIANVLKCRPPNNRDPLPQEVAACEDYLKRQVALVRPKVIVALGRFAAHSLLKTDEKLGSLRTRAHVYEEVPVIVTYHPAYLLRSLAEKAKAWEDLCRARAIYREAGGITSDISN
ncbi:MAG: uracil-DNA glycosylase [Janthinobacterium lividum]